MKKLLIWDFDGVIADTEKLWIQNRMLLLNKNFGLNWDMNKTYAVLGGMSDKTKKHVLEKLGLKTDEQFWEENKKLDLETMLKGFSLTDGVDNIFKDKTFTQCIATGGFADKTAEKIKIVDIESYFPPETVFTADMVVHGKPEPDLFLLAAEKMGFLPQDCIVVEDSVAGLTAAQKAGMLPLAFTGNSLYDNTDYLLRIKEIGITHLFDSISISRNFVGLLKLLIDCEYGSSGKPSDSAFIAHCVAFQLS